MKHITTVVVAKSLCAVSAVVFASVSCVSTALAHCDTMSGPVIAETKAALEKGDEHHGKPAELVSAQ